MTQGSARDNESDSDHSSSVSQTTADQIRAWRFQSAEITAFQAAKPHVNPLIRSRMPPRRGFVPGGYIRTA
jgi:hypothetical protein